MNKEMQSMLNFDVFEEVKMAELTPAQLETVISTRWGKTRKSDGTCRCRIVERGYDQVVEDPDETYASTPCLLTLKTLLPLAVARGLHVTLADVSTAFLHASMDGEVLALPPAEYYPSGDVVWRLKRAWYGLKNAPKLWQQHLATTLESKGFQQIKSDPNLYFQAERKIYLLCYVDDLILFGEQNSVADLVVDLQKELLLRATGELSKGQEATFLGRRMRRTSTSVQMFMETSYVDRILEFGGTCRAVVAGGAPAVSQTCRSAVVVEQLAHGHHVRDQGTFSRTCVADNRPLREAEALAAVLERYQGLCASSLPETSSVGEAFLT